MKASHVLSLIQKDYTTVRVAYKREDSKDYTFKALKADNLAVGDLVIIPSQYNFFMQVGEVRAVDAEPLIDTSADYDYKWIVGKVDLTRYNSILDLEERFTRTMATLERRRVANIALQEFTSAFPEGSQEHKDLMQLMGESANLAQLAQTVADNTGDTK